MSELVLTVSRLADYISGRVASDAVLRDVTVAGEISDVYIRDNIRIFSLCDERALVRCFVQAEAELNCELTDGAAVVVGGSVGYYAKDGRLTLFAASVMAAGEGERNAKLAELLRRLTAEGMFDAGRKKQLPAYPQRIGVVTSPEGAVIHDIITVAKRRFPGVDILVYPSRVQGERAAADLTDGIDYFNRESGVDLIIVARGGGSSDDLSAFDDETVVRAIAASALPLISAVGHETDTSLADLAADLRAPTPSAAAELALPLKRELTDELENRRRELNAAIRRIIAAERERLDVRRTELNSSMLRTITFSRQRLSVEKARLAALSPYATLSRGYAIVRRGERAVTSAGELAAGDDITLMMSGGSVAAEVRSVDDGEKL